MVQSQDQLGHVELDVLLGEHEFLGKSTEQVASSQEVENQVQLSLGLKCWRTWRTVQIERCDATNRLISSLAELTIMKTNDKRMIDAGQNVAFHFGALSVSH